MYLESITLRDWKAFEAERFTFPAPSSQQNVVLIGGKNGFGKTTLFEALALGLYGRDGLPLVMRAKVLDKDDRERTQSFKEFMERALFANALAHGRKSCCIKLKFIDHRKQPVEIERTWHFTDQGKYREESLVIYSGTARKPIGPSSSEPDREGWYRDWLARTFLPASLAGFFLYDGEMASIYAEREMERQVKEGMERLLGLDWLEKLRRDLETYASKKRATLPKDASTQAMEQLDAAILGMEAEMDADETHLQQVETDISSRNTSRNALIMEIGDHTGTRAQMEELIRHRADHEKQYEQAQITLREMATGKLPFALAGHPLLARVDARLDQEARREQWEAGLSRKDERTAKVMRSLNERLPAITPPLQGTQIQDVQRAVQTALERLWHPPPEDIADRFRHGHVHGIMRVQVQNHLNDARALSSASVIELLDTWRNQASSIDQFNKQIETAERTPLYIEEKRRRIETLNGEIEHLHGQRMILTNKLASRREELKQKRAERKRLTAHLDQSQTPARLAARADQVAQMLGELIIEAWPLQSAAIAKAMTSAIQDMAHRNAYFHKVSITPDGDVALHSPDGRNLRNHDLSAGEKQIFTQALFSAVAEVSGCMFPLVVDTPLGRLDKEHRRNVLRHIAHRRGQVILISTNTEVVGDHLDAIRGRIAKCYLLHNKVQNGVARSWCEPGYFDGQGI